MGTKSLKSIVAATAAMALFSALGVAPASAAGITFKWSPKAVTGNGADSDFTADHINSVVDYATIFVPSTGIGVQETGVLDLTQFSNLGFAFTPFGLGNSVVGGDYQLFITFSATSNLLTWDPNNPTQNFQGYFTDLDYNMYLDIGGNDTFHAPATTSTDATSTNGTITGSDTLTLLAHGSLAPGQNGVSLTGGIPGAGVTATFNEDFAGFFIAPPSTVFLNLLASFTNNGPTQSSYTQSSNPCGGTCTTTFTINQGGGTADFVQAVPEPGTLAMFGLGLLGLGFVGRRRSKQS